MPPEVSISNRNAVMDVQKGAGAGPSSPQTQRDRVTPDLGGSGTTETFADAMIERLFVDRAEG